MQKKNLLLFFVLVLVSVSGVSAQDFALDINTDKQIYAAGENVTYTTLLLQDSSPFQDQVQVSFTDASGLKSSQFIVPSNQPNQFFIDKDFPSGYWKIEATYKNKVVRRFFSVGEREEAEFSIEGDTLIIKNTGNVPYTKNIQILIGEKIVTQKQNIDLGSHKTIRLLAPEGIYNVQVTDGIKTIAKNNIYLAGTGRVIGALDEDLVKNQPVLGGARDPSQDSSFFLSKNFSIAFIFIGAVFGLFILLGIERLMRHRRAKEAHHALK